MVQNGSRLGEALRLPYPDFELPDEPFAFLQHGPGGHGFVIRGPDAGRGLGPSGRGLPVGRGQAVAGGRPGDLPFAASDDLLVEERPLLAGGPGAVVDLVPHVPDGRVRVLAGLNELPLGLGDTGRRHRQVRVTVPGEGQQVVEGQRSRRGARGLVGGRSDIGIKERYNGRDGSVRHGRQVEAERRRARRGRRAPGQAGEAQSDDRWSESGVTRAHPCLKPTPADLTGRISSIGRESCDLQEELASRVAEATRFALSFAPMTSHLPVLRVAPHAGPGEGRQGRERGGGVFFLGGH